MSNEGDVLIRKVGGRISSERHVKMITGKKMNVGSSIIGVKRSNNKSRCYLHQNTAR